MNMNIEDTFKKITVVSKTEEIQYTAAKTNIHNNFRTVNILLHMIKKKSIIIITKYIRSQKI